MAVLFLFSCASGEYSKPTPKSTISSEELRRDCEEKNSAIACARYGYVTKDLRYTREACSLGEESACFNLREIEGRAPNQNFAIINSQQNLIYGCYVNHSIDEDNGEGLKKEKELELDMEIDREGKLSRVSVLGEKLSENFKACVMSSFTSRRFIATDQVQSIRYAFTLPAVTKDRRRKGKTPGDF